MPYPWRGVFLKLRHTLKLVGALRIELRPRAPEARMQRITLSSALP